MNIINQDQNKLITPSKSQKLMALSVHAFTSLGIVAAFIAIIAITKHDFRTAMIWLFIALIIDGVDGTFARLFKVNKVLPNWNGTTIDNVIDFATYAIIPAFFLFEAQNESGYLLPESEIVRLGLAGLIVFISAMYYGKDGMVSDDNCFVGFPVMWNIVAFYFFFVWDLPPNIYAILIVFFAILHFVPIKYPYPSRNGNHFYLTLTFTILFFLANTTILLVHPESYMVLRILSMIAILYFALSAIFKTFFEKESR